MSFFKLLGDMFASKPKAPATSKPVDWTGPLTKASSLPRPPVASEPSLDLRGLVSKLDDACRLGLEAAAGLAVNRTHYNVEVEHWLIELVQSQEGDVSDVIKTLALSKERLLLSLNRTIDQFRTGNPRAPALSPQIVNLLREIWLVASVNHDARSVSGLHILRVLLMKDEYLWESTHANLCDFIRVDALVRELNRTAGAARTASEIDCALGVWDELQREKAAGKEIFAINPANRFERTRLVIPTLR